MPGGACPAARARRRVCRGEATTLGEISVRPRRHGGHQSIDLDEKKRSGTALLLRGLFGASVCTAPAGEAAQTPDDGCFVVVLFLGFWRVLREKRILGSMKGTDREISSR